MTTVKVNFHNEQEERVLLSILESLDYDYELQYTQDQKEAIDRAKKVKPIQKQAVFIDMKML